MASLTLYGSSVFDTTLTTACASATALGGTETSNNCDMNGSLDYGEITNRYVYPTATVSAIPATPTGKGWVYNKPGAGTFAAGNWQASIAIIGVGGDTVNITIRFFRYSSGTYTSIGNITASNFVLPTSKTTLNFAATSFSSVTFGASDLLYWDFWLYDSTGAGGDNPTLYVSNSATAGVADMVITTSSFTASGPTLNSYSVTEQAPTYQETINLLGAQSFSEQGSTYAETIYAQSITLYPALTEQAPTYQETINLLGIYSVTEQAPTYQESVSNATPYVVSEQAPTYQETVSLTFALTVSEQAPTEQETVNLTANRIVLEQAVTYTETVSIANIVPTYTYTVNDVNFAVETVSVTNSVVITSYNYTVSELAPPTYQETIAVDPISQSLPNAPMTQFDLEAQYSRIEASALVSRLQFCAITYYSSAGATKILEGEIDALLTTETIDMLHELKTINDVNTFLYSYDYVSSVLEDNPILYARLGDGAGGSAMDISGNNFNGSVLGGVTTGQAGAIYNDPNKSMLFDGSSGYILLPAQLNTTSWGAFSFEVWVNLSGAVNWFRILANDLASSSNKGFEWGLAPASAGYLGYLDVGLGSANTQNHFSGSLTPGIWYHLAVTWNNGSVTFFVNGQIVNQITSTGGTTAPGSYPINIGRDPSANTDFFAGRLDEIAIYPYALDPARIAYRYALGEGLAI